MNKAILFNPETFEAKYVEVSDFRDIQTKIGCRYFTCIQVRPEETIYCDDEGLMNGTSFGSKLHDYPEPVMGNLLFLGNTKDGSSADTTFDTDDVLNMVDYTLERGVV